MMAKPVRALELHYPMIQFLIISVTQVIYRLAFSLKETWLSMRATERTGEKTAELQNNVLISLYLMAIILRNLYHYSISCSRSLYAI